jgi:hypothetical protein
MSAITALTNHQIRLVSRPVGLPTRANWNFTSEAVAEPGPGGVLVKTGPDVRVSVRRAKGGADLGQLRQAVEKEFLAMDEHEQNVRSVLAKLETGFLRRFATFQHD